MYKSDLLGGMVAAPTQVPPLTQPRWGWWCVNLVSRGRPAARANPGLRCTIPLGLVPVSPDRESQRDSVSQPGVVPRTRGYPGNNAGNGPQS